ncbi:MAG: hypothetical protein MJB14_23065, partial [Spirochaetes bacterium]|nr:hypothetical protein [Spirochaetota bacterium]
NTKKDIQDEPVKMPEVSNKEDLTAVYYRLITGIKEKNLDKIMLCYADNSHFFYDEGLHKKLLCYDKSLKVTGKEQILRQYQYLFSIRLLDQIEFGLRKIDEKKAAITFVNAWTLTDYKVAETIVLTEIDGRYYIDQHHVHRYDP